MPDTPFAYSLSHVESGWTWRIYDEEGETVASGSNVSQSGAQAAVEATIRRVAEQSRLSA
ncbi:MAG: hypothetical protein ACK4YQ_01680 [Phenylobacterium sp.]|uniref:hypothetical protein n=1 Tax=Phenylobacterium sp. TaxID=1871053 RepID=UPI00391AADFE